ncbi:WYL domain-containing protein [Virgibacillus sp. 179-BFC.A HS]|uniref:WYL domain-containing protein n=1 Tax=Tigheibacillus jepli TaxID=3035914 RepID=A0ABU5CDQ4_9BACI|nr:WYL domain-containing protein [Virgibacillus sp. 179-BFC.A HS]MDY0404467.1 WYL domain-containing protein [Virgibacillus sp. 179-BFC.A HS]
MARVYFWLMMKGREAILEKLERNNSYRLLKLREMLFQKTDEMNELSIDDINKAMEKYIINGKYDKRTLKKDLDALDEMDFEIVRNKGKYGKILYSHQTRLFETYQLRLMIDAVLSAKFITPNEKKQLLDKLKSLTSEHIAKTLPQAMVFSQSANMDYELIKLNIDSVHRAIVHSRVLQFKYGRYNVDKEFVYSRDGAVYDVEPYALIWQNDYYYLIGRHQELDEIRHYRLDRIRHIGISEQSFKKQDFHLQEYVDRSFHMFAGEEIWIKIRFHNDLVNVVLDRFGQDADIRKQDAEHFVLKTKAKLSQGLINWILTWGNKAKVLEPDSLVDTVKEKINNMLAVYERQPGTLFFIGKESKYKIGLINVICYDSQVRLQRPATSRVF